MSKNCKSTALQSSELLEILLGEKKSRTLPKVLKRLNKVANGKSIGSHLIKRGLGIVQTKMLPLTAEKICWAFFIGFYLCFWVLAADLISCIVSTLYKNNLNARMQEGSKGTDPDWYLNQVSEQQFDVTIHREVKPIGIRAVYAKRSVKAKVEPVENEPKMRARDWLQLIDPRYIYMFFVWQYYISLIPEPRK